MRATADLLFALLSVLEGLRLLAYKDSAGIWTIGFGHTLNVKEGDTCSLDQARAWMEEDCAPLLKRVSTILSPVASAAYCSFGYNCGLEALDRVLSGEANMLTFIHAGGRVSEGLIHRRALESALIAAIAPAA